jgi:uncharacterized membrane protein
VADTEPASGEVTTGWPARLAYSTAVTAYIALIALLLAWIIWLAPAPTSLISPILLVIVAPLLIPLRGLLHRRRYTLAWSTLLILAYFIHGLVYAAGTGIVVWLGSGETALSLLYFSAINAYLRLTRGPRAPRE